MYPKHWPNVHQIKTLFTYHYTKTCPHSLAKINWTVSYWVLLKVKSKSCYHQITFLASHIWHQKAILFPPNSMNSYSNHSSAWVSAWCFKTHTFSLLCVYGDGFKCWPSGLLVIYSWPINMCLFSLSQAIIIEYKYKKHTRTIDFLKDTVHTMRHFIYELSCQYYVKVI